MFTAYAARCAIRSSFGSGRKRGTNTKPWDRTILSLYSILLLVLFPVCGLVAMRYRACSLPLGAKKMGWAGMALPGMLILRGMEANTFASRTARIQDDRGQTFMSGGPCRCVRYPMCLGIILLFLHVPLALGSGWGFLPATRNSRAGPGSGCCRDSGEGAGAALRLKIQRRN